MHDWNKTETIVVLLLLCAVVACTYYSPITLDEAIYAVDTVIGGEP